MNIYIYIYLYIYIYWTNPSKNETSIKIINKNQIKSNIINFCIYIYKMKSNKVKWMVKFVKI